MATNFEDQKAASTLPPVVVSAEDQAKAVDLNAAIQC